MQEKLQERFASVVGVLIFKCVKVFFETRNVIFCFMSLALGESF